MVVRRSSIKTSYFAKSLLLIVCGTLLFTGLSFYYFKEYRNEQAYAKQIKVIYELMDKNAYKAESIVSSYANDQGVVSRYGEGIVAGSNSSFRYDNMVKTLRQDSEKCRDLLFELSEPPEEMTEVYAILLDAHITYKQYIQLALRSQEPTANFAKKEQVLREELNNGLALVKNRIEQM
ncbi:MULTISPECIES: hypothetical protein [Bacillaceae]|uniref:hypothetical protein n=1 Tax=Bacillaceae TaxID=186817 RepID=UPI000E73C359|nr:hypothetical protein [Bacillus sp. PK3_68]RJS62306.1 hypothetical protein CJ483_21440 [Bacillus sp. PK3_68]